MPSILFFDDFDGTYPDPTRWKVAEEKFDAVGGHLQHYTKRPKNVRCEGGKLILEAHKEYYNGQPFTSGRVSTKGLFERQYGYFEALIQNPLGSGVWPSDWMSGYGRGVLWPLCGEIDKYEYWGIDRNVITTNLFGGNDVAGPLREHPWPNPEGFHHYALDWRQGRITWLFDGTEARTTRPQDVPWPWPYDTYSQFLLLCFQVRIARAGDPNLNTWPQRMLIDWVKVSSNEAPVPMPGPLPPPTGGQMQPKDTSARSLRWTAEADGSLWTYFRQEWVEYSVKVEQEGKYRLNLTGINKKLDSAPGVPPDFKFDLGVSLNSQPIGSIKLPCAYTEQSAGLDIDLMPGTWTIRLTILNDSWENGNYDSNLWIKKISLDAISTEPLPPPKDRARLKLKGLGLLDDEVEVVVNI